MSTEALSTEAPINAQIEDADVEELVAMVWESVIGEPVYQTGPEGDRSGWLVGTVDVAGPWPGEIAILAPTALADHLAVVLFALDADQVTEADRTDALGELTNMTGGNLKALVEGSNQLGLPEVSQLTTGWDEAVKGRTVLVEMWFSAAGHSFSVRITQPG